VSQITGSGGVQLLFRRPAWIWVRELGNSTGSLPDPEHVHGRCDGGYIVAPPSRHVSGRRYEWDNHPDDHELAEPPAWLIAALTGDDGRKAPLPALDPEAKIMSGTRNITLARYAGAMRRKGLSAEAITAALLVENEEHCRPPLAAAEVRKIAQSIARYEPGDPILSDSPVTTIDAPGQRQLLTGADVLDLPETIPAVWGAGQRVGWAENERLMICAPQGTGKTTLAQRLALARCGLAHDVLGMPVIDDGSAVLYIASDRPAQALRSLRRMLNADRRSILGRRLFVWKGAVPVGVVRDPVSLLAWVERLGEQLGTRIGTVVFDSAKDIAPALSKDEVGSAVDHALRHLSDAGVQVLVLHHLRKAQGESRSGKPRGLDEVFGSTWLTGGSGSVLLLWGEPGELVVELSTLKPIADPVGPFDVVVDHDRGAMTADPQVDPADLLRAAGPTGLSALELVRELNWQARSNERAAKQRARRALDRLVEDGVADREDGSRVAAARWYWTGAACTSVHPPREPARAPDDVAQLGSRTEHAHVHAVHEGSEVHVSGAASLSPCRGRGQRGENVHPAEGAEDELVQAAKRELDATEIGGE
jgi:hypothetical protein